MKLQYDDLVVGSGVSGMTVSLLLAGTGRRVLLLEKSNAVGGSMQRFRRNSVPFDTGFHFTTNFTGCMGDMIRMLGLEHELECVPIGTNVIIGGRRLRIPRGRDRACAYLCGEFPGEKEKIRRYFETEKRIYDNTALFDLRTPGGFTAAQFLDEDFISLADYLDSLGVSGELRAILASFATCHGTPPSEISLADHCRVSYGLLDDLVRVKGGGGAFVEAFLRKARELGITILTGTTMEACLELEKKRCHKVLLTDGSEVSFENCFMTIHPHGIAKILPQSVQSEDFRKRIGEFGETCGFFTVFCTLDPPVPEFHQELSSCFSTPDVEMILSGRHLEATATAVMLTWETASGGEQRQTLTAFETVFPEETREWENTVHRTRPPSYSAYKQAKAQGIIKKVLQVYPQFEGHLKLAETASMLTYRDYLSPFGSAYGIRQRMEQHNLFGRLPIRNFYVLGQSALLPGAMGAMLSAFVIWRKLIGEEIYRKMPGLNS